ncbi:MAG: transglycosylase SLT domain-containing protein [Solimonas sp.]
MKNRALPKSVLLLALLSGLLPPFAQAQDERARDEAVRQQFRAAMLDARAGRVPAQEDSAALRAYVLFPYLEGTRIQGLLSRAAPGSVDAAAASFIERNPDLVVTRELRRQWLQDFGRRGEWAQYLARYVPDNADPALVCYRWQARLADVAAAAPGLQAELLDFWRQAPQMPASCTPPFQWLQDQGAITADALEQRTRKALADGNSNLAGALLARLPAERAAPLKQWQRLLDDPQRTLGEIAADPQQRFEWPALKAGFQKLVRRDAGQAETALQQLRSRLDGAQYSDLAQAVALGLAWNREADALNYFQQLPADALDERVQEWRVRNALWQQQWALAAQWLQAQPAALAAEPRWTYWRARVAEKLGRKDEARAIYTKLMQDNGYYSVLSAWRLGERYTPRRRALEPNQGVQQRLLRLPALLRARELFYVDEINWANAEWRAATLDLPEADRTQAALLADGWGWHWQSVILLTQMNATDALDQLYPQKVYAKEIAQGAKQADLPPAWIYGVMRQESLFLPRAVSSSDALGLLQLKLGTARDVARKLGQRKPERDDLFDPALNVTLGSSYLRQMTDRYGGQFVLTTASYNAGPNAVARWLPDAPMDADVWIENVPYNETRGYVQRIAWHIAAHDWQTTGKIRDFDDLLQPVRRP